MNPKLQVEIEALRRTLARHNKQPAALNALSNNQLSPLSAPPPRVAERPVEAAELVLRGDAQPLLEALESFSARQVARVASALKPLALRIYALLNILGCTLAERRGYHRKAGQVSYFCPAELICAHLGISRGSFYRSLKQLIALGLVAARGHKTTLNGWAVRCDGTLWSVKLLPNQGSKAKLRYEDLKANYRDLAGDIELGRTVYKQMRQSKTQEAKPVEFESLLAWALTSPLEKNPVTLTVASHERLELEILLDVPFAPKQGRRQAVDKASRAMAQHVGDTASLNFYRYLTWQLLRLQQQGRDRFMSI